MKQKKMNWKEMSIGLCLVALLAWFTFHMLLGSHSAQTLGSTFMRADIRFVAIGFACMFLFVNCEAANIRLLMGTFGKKVPYWRSLSYAFTDFYFSAITPSATGGQPMQLYYMVRDGFGAAHSSFSLLATAAVYQMTVLVYGCVMVGANLSFVMGQGRIIRLLLVFGVLVNGFCSGLILLIIFHGLLAEKTMLCIAGGLSRAGIIKNRKRAIRKVEGLIDEYSRGGAYLRQYPLAAVRIFIHSAVQLTAFYLVPYWACRALGISASAKDFLALQAILSLAVTAVPLPGSVGASEGSFLVLYRTLLGAGQSFSVMLLSRGISFYAMLCISGLATAFLQFARRGKSASPV